MLTRHHQLERLEPRRLLTAAPSPTFTIDPTQSVHSISRFIYGANSQLSGALSNLTLERSGGNRWTAYNWENNASNAGSDYYFENDSQLGGGNTPGGAIIPTITDAASHNAATLITIPINGYVSADKNGGGNVEYNNNTYNPQNNGWINGTANPNYLAQRFVPELPAKPGGNFSLTPSTSDGAVYEDEFVNWVKQNYGYGQTDPNKPIWFDLDNEPDLWAETHSEVHPAAPTYAEMVQKTIAYASAIKNVEPNALVFGPVNYGWGGYTNLQGAPDANGRDFQAYYLQQMKLAEQAIGKRLIDTLDVHWYPEAQGTNGVRITDEDNSAATVAARLQAPRSLWDPTYTENSWITQFSTLGPIDLLPRLNTKISQNYPGTKLSISEYNYGGATDISGAIAESDVLGIFGRDGVFAAAEWQLAQTQPFINAAFNMFRNYDGNKSTFGDTSVQASTSDVANTSVYASIDSTNPNVLTIVAINKNATATSAKLDMSHVYPVGQADVYTLTSANASPQSAGHLTIGDPTNFNYTMPGYSVTTMRIPLIPPPMVMARNFAYQANPNTLTFTFSKDVSQSLQSLGSSELVVKPAGSSSALPTTYIGSDANHVASFSLGSALPDGNYTATLNPTGISDSSGVPMTSGDNFSFFALTADANHDRTVSSADFAILAQNFGNSGMNFSQGDFNYDGKVNALDFNVLAANYGKHLAAPGSAPVLDAAPATKPLLNPAAAATPNAGLFSSALLVSDQDHHSLLAELAGPSAV